MEIDFKEVFELRRSEKFTEALALLAKMQMDNPQNPDISYQIGWTYDASEQPFKAIPLYQKALELGLSEDRNGCFLALGSSLRATGKYEDSDSLLSRGLSEFPNDKALKMFACMTAYNVGKNKVAVSDLLKLLVETSNDENIQAYRPAILEYTEDLDATF